jgi:hypothetical protein
MRRVWVVLLALILATPAGLQAKPKTVKVHWAELEALILGEKVKIELPDATLEGTVIGIMDSGLSLDVIKTTNESTHPRGSLVVAKESLQQLRLYRPRGRLFRYAILALPTAAVIAVGSMTNNRGVRTALLVVPTATRLVLPPSKLFQKVTVIQIEK